MLPNSFKVHTPKFLVSLQDLQSEHGTNKRKKGNISVQLYFYNTRCLLFSRRSLFPCQHSNDITLGSDHETSCTGGSHSTTVFMSASLRAPEFEAHPFFWVEGTNLLTFQARNSLIRPFIERSIPT